MAADVRHRSSAEPTTAIEQLHVDVFRVPTDEPEADGTAEWEWTDLVLVRLDAGGHRGLGYTYADPSTGVLVADTLARSILGADALSPPALHERLGQELRNTGRPGIGAEAISAVDVAMWDLKAKLLGLPLVTLLGQVRESTAAYGSGGFTTYGDERLSSQLREWVDAGIGSVKIKVGARPDDDLRRIALARESIGDEPLLYVDANGAYTAKQALQLLDEARALRITRIEEPVSSDDLSGLRLVRDRSTPGVHVTAGEYGYSPWYFRRMLEARCVDVLQADATRCGGVTGYLAASALAEAFALPLSAHTAPALHTTLACATRASVDVEYFHDHVRLEPMLFAGTPRLHGGRLAPDRARVGHGLELRESAAEYRTFHHAS